MQPKILKESIENLPISDELRHFMVKRGYKNLEELTKEGTPKLQRTKGFTMHCFESLLNVLKANNCLHLLKEC